MNSIKMWNDCLINKNHEIVPLKNLLNTCFYDYCNGKRKLIDEIVIKYLWKEYWCVLCSSIKSIMRIAWDTYWKVTDPRKNVTSATDSPWYSISGTNIHVYHYALLMLSCCRFHFTVKSTQIDHHVIVSCVLHLWNVTKLTSKLALETQDDHKETQNRCQIPCVFNILGQ